MTLAFLRLGLARCDKVRGQFNFCWVTCGRNDLPGFAFSTIIWLTEIKRLKLSVSDLDKRVRAPTMPANLWDKKENRQKSGWHLLHKPRGVTMGTDSYFIILNHDNSIFFFPQRNLKPISCSGLINLKSPTRLFSVLYTIRYCIIQALFVFTQSFIRIFTASFPFFLICCVLCWKKGFKHFLKSNCYTTSAGGLT